MKRIIKHLSNLLERYPFIKFALGGIPGSGLGYFILDKWSPDISGEANLEKIKSLILISIIAFLVKESVNFPIHKWWTFKELKKEKLIKELLYYFSIMALILLINSIAFVMLTMLFGVGAVLSQIIINLVSGFINFTETREILKKD